MKPLRANLLVLVGVAAMGVAACTEEVIVLARVPGEKDEMGEKSKQRCSTNADCRPGSFCERECDEPAGACIPFPVSCAKEEERPVCGCNGVTYFNDCLRKADGVPRAQAEECSGPPYDCASANEPCPDGAVCARLFGFGLEKGACSTTEGRCWRLPALCPTDERGDRWDECEGSEKSLRCVDTCMAIRSGKAFVRANRCE